mmetsp:Transcript_14037/g.44675  ORF Transcript_14037/g.44675 Transcript_14037/m.44675 type:complete len:204 (-) Transcript_14037:1058-1669(-)|eukprot:CAMPEP_0182865186 /NCGR_PEP_ID=MMETSP0034_2-20130328/7558_1 /TAXON_ID=156128 /ORGANISM="Nephroselmis pyriformis, Strain CCMP717" /LENGTH=203 /DNA_ID=CAMNT_0024997475 /DNA_START=381 /DNA_END=992 /DNA_ORIENTATION=+
MQAFRRGAQALLRGAEGAQRVFPGIEEPFAQGWGMTGQGIRHLRKPKKKLPIIMLQDVDGLGMKNDIVEVRHGYGRNKLIPERLATYATRENIERLGAKAPGAEVAKEVGLSRQRSMVAKVLKRMATGVEIKRVLNEEENRIGIVTADNVVKACRKQLEVEIVEAVLQFPAEPIKELGEYTIPLNVDIGDGKSYTLPVNVVQR